MQFNLRWLDDPCYSLERDAEVVQILGESPLFDKVRGCTSVVDLCCGTGSICQLFPDAEYVGVDYSAPACQLGRQRYGSPHRTFVEADVEFWKPDRTFDLAVSITTIGTFRTLEPDWEPKVRALFRLMIKISTVGILLLEGLGSLNWLLHDPEIEPFAEHHWMIDLLAREREICLCRAFAMKLKGNECQ